MKATILIAATALAAFAALPPGYEHWTAEDFHKHEEALHKAVKDGLASETLGTWGNHLLLKTRREASSGRAELHQKQSDLIIVQAGEATLVVGGKIVNGQTTAPNETRGTSIEGGETQIIRTGDVVHVPVRTPHQLIKTSKTFDYIVLKVDEP